jgi:hypothetical protein
MVRASAGADRLHGQLQQHRREFAMEILVAILAIVGVGLGYRYWRARTAH